MENSEGTSHDQKVVILPLLKTKPVKKILKRAKRQNQQQISASSTDASESSLDSVTGKKAKANFKWTKEAEEQLIAEYSLNLLKFQDPAAQTSKLWTNLANRMKRKKFEVNMTMCYSKFNSLRKKFKEM